MDFEFALKSAQTLLDKLELEDAEDKFCKLLSDLNMEEKKGNLDPRKMKSSSMMEVECLIGVAECRSKSFKMGRYLKDDFWFQCFIIPLCLLHKSRKLIQSILEANSDPHCPDVGRADKMNGDFQTKIQNRLNRLEFNISSLEDNFIRGFLRKTFNGNNSGTQRLKPGSSMSVNKTWIFELVKICDVADVFGWSKRKKSELKHSPADVIESEDVRNENKLMNSNFPTERKTEKQSRLKSSQSFKHQRPSLSVKHYRGDTFKSGGSTESRDTSPNPSTFSSKSRTINFERFQEAIQTFVSDISSEVRTRYGLLSKVPESLIERRLASEIALRLSPGSIQAEDYINVLEGALVAGITETVDDQSNDVKEEEILAEMQRMEELQREKERLLALDNEEDEDENSYETLHLDVGQFLQGTICEEKSTKITDDKLVSPQKLAVTWTKDSTSSKENSLNVVVPRSQGSPLLVTDDKSPAVTNLSQTLKQLRRDILFVWRRLETKEQFQETNVPHKMDVKDKRKIFFLKNESHFEELSNLNRCQNSSVDDNTCHTNIKVTIEDISWPFQKVKKSDVVLMLLELLIKAARYESVQNHHHESVELLQIADKIVNEHWDTSYQETEVKKIVALVWGDLGEELSKSGQVSKGSFYLEKQKGLTSRQESKLSRSSSGKVSIFEEVTMWCKLGDAYLGEDLRSESLLARLMQLTKEELIRLDETYETESKPRLLMDQYLSDLYKNKDGESLSDKGKPNDDDEFDDDEKEERDVYCTCLQEAVDCFTTAVNILQANRTILGNDRPELWSEILIKMADCHLMCGNLDLAETAYDEALDHVSRAVGPEHLRRNADAMLALATLCFITGNNIRACTLLLTSLALRGKYCDKRGLNNNQNDYNRIDNDPYNLIKLQNSLDLEEDEIDFGTVWTMMILSLAHHSLGKPHQAISWASRAFTAHGQFFHGRLVAVDFLNRWFLVRILLSWATNHIVLSNPHESISRLAIAQKLLDVSGSGDRYQMSQILKTFGDAYLLLSSGMGLNPEDIEENASIKYLEKSEYCYSKALERFTNDKVSQNKLLGRINFFRAHKKYSPDKSHDKFESHQLQITWIENNDEKDEIPKSEVRSKFDFILILLEMANDHVMNYNLDQSLACFVECSRELEKSWAAEVQENEGFLLASVYFRLGRLLHVKYLMSCDQPDELQCYSDASIRVFDIADDVTRKLISPESERLHLDILIAKSCLLYDLDKKYDAIQTFLPVLFKCNDEEITFAGQEMFALPKHLRSIFSGNYFDSSLTIKRRYLLGLLATTCFKEMGLMDFATESICSMIRDFNPAAGNFLDHMCIAFSFMHLGFYDDAFRVFSDLSKICHERGRKYLSCCTYVCLLLHLRFIVHRILWIILEKTFLNLKKTFRLLTFGEFLQRMVRSSKMCTNLDVPKISLRSTSPKLKWTSGSCGQENVRRSPNSVPFKIETGVTSRKLKEIPTRSFFAPSTNVSNLTSDRQKRPQQATQIFNVI